MSARIRRTSLRFTFTSALVLAATSSALGVGCGPSDPKIVVHAGVPVVIDPAPDKPGFDPRSARLRASAREVENVVGHPVVLHVDAALLSNEPTQFEETLCEAMTALAKNLVGIKAEDPAAFSHGVAKLKEIFTRYEPLAKYPRARFDSGGQRLVVELGSHPRSLVPFEAVLDAMLDAYDDATDARISGATPRSQEEIAEHFAWLTRTRPGRGSVYVHRAEARATTEGRENAGREAQAHVRELVIGLEGKTARESTELRGRMQAWLVDELPRIEYQKRDEKKLALLPRDSAVFRSEREYDKWVERRFWELPEALAKRITDVLFPRGEPCHGSEATCAKGRALSGVPRLELGMALLAEARGAGWGSARAPHPTLVHAVICPAERDPLGKPRETCNASFAAHALATPEGRARLLSEVTSSRDPWMTAEIAATLAYASPDDIRGYLRGLERHPVLYKEAVRALVFGVWDKSRGVLEEETRKVWTTGDPELRAAALTVLAETRGSLHRHYADGYFERFEKEWGALVDDKTLAAFLDGSPRSFAAVPRIWKALKPSARVGPFLAGLDRYLSATPESLSEPRTTTLEALVARLCEGSSPTDVADLDRVHRALEAVARRSAEHARSVGNALDDSAPKRCPKRPSDAKEAKDAKDANDHGY